MVFALLKKGAIATVNELKGVKLSLCLIFGCSGGEKFRGTDNISGTILDRT